MTLLFLSLLNLGFGLLNLYTFTTSDNILYAILSTIMLFTSGACFSTFIFTRRNY